MSKNGSGEPPSWEDLVNQVQGAMEELNLNSPENQTLFVEGLKEVMESLEGMGFQLGMPPIPPPPGASKPDIQVFEGGKAETPKPKDAAAQIEDAAAEASSEPTSDEEKKPTKQKRPNLKVAPP